jgi:hypothetical protein
MNIHTLTVREKELYTALKNGVRTCKIEDVSDSQNIAWKVSIYVTNVDYTNLDISASLSKDGSLFFGWITDDCITTNLHPVEWKFIMAVMKELSPDFAKIVSELA